MQEILNISGNFDLRNLHPCNIFLIPLDISFFKIFEKCKRPINKIQSQSSKISKDKYVTLYKTDTSARVREENKCGWNKNFIYCPKGEFKYIQQIYCAKSTCKPHRMISLLCNIVPQKCIVLAFQRSLKGTYFFFKVTIQFFSHFCLSHVQILVSIVL